MNESKIAVRYAKAFFELGQEKNQLGKLRTDIEFIALTCEQPNIKLLLESPVVKISKKKQILTEIFKSNIQVLSLNFILMIIDNKREMHIPAICRNFIDKYRKHKGIKAAKVTTAFAIDDSLKKQIIKVISDIFKSNVELTTAENSEIVGGFILRVGDQQIDASVSSKLNKIKRELIMKKV